MGTPDDFGGNLFASFGPQAGLYLLESFLHQRIDCYVMMKAVLVFYMVYEALKGLTQVKMGPGQLLQSCFEYLMMIELGNGQ